ncbi:hypothetical protein ACMFMG_003054 [Clarireedia jacksonii]
MSTVSIGRSAVVNDTGNFGHFRINQFVDAATGNVNATELHPRIQTPNANLVTSSKTPVVITNGTGTAAAKDSMAQSSRPASGQNNKEPTPTVAPAKSSQQEQATTSSGEGFRALELVELNSNSALEGVLGPNKDGRVRNPVPSKLKGKTDNKKGNFGVMHMAASPAGKKEVPGKDAAAERDAAARRTSENTASRAKAAQTEKFIPPKKRGLDAAKQEVVNRVSPFGSRDDTRQRARPLTPDETKHEQARLLTLLRSINPVTVVDQVCKAVAYFGGIPGAPPPEDGIFPESANTRETGALFIGWLAEIFPDLSRAPPEPPVPKLQEPPSSSKGKRGRGRPPRDSKGIPSGENGTSEPPGPSNGFGFGPAVQAPTWGLPQSVTLLNTAPPMAAPPVPPVPSATPTTFTQTPQQPPQAAPQPQPERPETPVTQQTDDGILDNASTSKRRRGRPKGSRNKGKEAQTGGESSGTNNGEAAVDQGPSEKNVQHTPAVAQMTAEKPASAKESPIVPMQKNTNNNAQPRMTYSAEHWPTESSAASSSAILPQQQISPEERAVLEVLQREGGPSGGPSGGANAVNFNANQMTPVNNGATPTGIKRKRGPNKPKPVPNASAQNPSRPQSQASHVNQNASPLPPPAESPVVQKENVQWASVETTAVPPPAKRQRKPKPTAPNDPAARKKAASVVSNATPPIPPSTIPDSPATSNQGIQQQTTQQQQSVPVTRPAADVGGLEAHYARFENSIQNARSVTPSVPPQIRQHQKNASVQQATPQQMVQQNSQQAQQVQMQQQTSQQSNSRDEQKMAQNSTGRTTSNPYFPRNTAANYVSQYPSHQTPQQYSNHQPSPQLSNTYRSNNMTQPSPQFSQADNTYRTASPHITQQSPSFSQVDSTAYRTPSSLAQTSPTYSQPEVTSYNPRTSSLSAATNPSSYSQPDYKPSSSLTAAYSRPSASSHQPQQHQSYNHFTDASWPDLPSLDSLGSHNSYGAAAAAGMSAMQNSSTRSNAGGSIYGTSSGLGGAFDTGGNDLLRVSRTGSGSVGTGYAGGAGVTGGYAGGGAVGTGGFDAGEERLVKGMYGRGR